jgi:UDP-N-acetylglucosamine acyltransferase
MAIHPTAIIALGAKIDSGVTIGPWCNIGPNVVISKGTKLGANVIIEGHTTIGSDNEISHFTTIGTAPQHLHFSGEACPVIIGNNNVIREYCSIHRGTEDDVGRKSTIIGDNNFFMVYVHIAHDCMLGSNITIANHTSLAGHVTFADNVMTSGYVAIHQFCSIGKYAFLGRCTKVGQDIIPYVNVAGTPGYPTGLNLVGLKRSGFSSQEIRAIKHAYKVLFQENLKLSVAIEKLQQSAIETPAVAAILDFIAKTKRSIARPTKKVEKTEVLG